MEWNPNKKMIWHPYKNIDPFKIPETADKLLNEFWTLAQALDTKPFLYMGTCLGFVRGDGYIYADNDIDVGVLSGFEELTAALISNGFERKKKYRENLHFLKYDILLDVSFDFPDRQFLQSFDKVTYKNRVYNVPHPVEEYLKDRYGKYGDWKTKILRTLHVNGDAE